MFNGQSEKTATLRLVSRYG